MASDSGSLAYQYQCPEEAIDWASELNSVNVYAQRLLVSEERKLLNSVGFKRVYLEMHFLSVKSFIL